MRAACGLVRVEQLSHRGGAAFLACAVVWAGPWSFSRWWVWMKRRALPVVVGVQGRVKRWRMPSHQLDLAERRERKSGALSGIAGLTWIMCSWDQRRVRS